MSDVEVSSRSRDAQSATYVIAAGTQITIAAHCQFVHCINASAPFKLSVNNGGDMYFSANSFYQAPDSFPTFEITNEGASALTVTMVFGWGEYRYNGVTITGLVQADPVIPSGLQTTADVSVPATTAQQVVAANTSRKAVMVGNLGSNAAAVRIGDASVGAARGVELLAGATLTLQTTAAVWAYNGHTSAQSLQILEVL